MEKENKFDINFKEMLSDGQEINKILNHSGQDQFEIKEILSTYEKNDNRHGIIVTAKDNKTEKYLKIIIDAIYGEPNSTQVKDVIYNYGVDCNKRIILYTFDYLGLKVRSYEYDREMSEGFIKICNDHGCDIYLIEVSKILADSRELISFIGVIEPGSKKLTSLGKLPTKQEFEQAEFGIFYHYTIDWDYDYIERPEDWFDNYWHLIFHDISFRYPIWTEEGLFLQGVSKSEIGDVTLKWLMDSTVELLKKFFENRKIQMNKLSPERDLLKIKLWDKPFSYFTEASVEEKERMVDGIRRYDRVIFEFLDDLFGRDMSDDKILKDLGCIPEHAFKDLDKELTA